MLCRKCWVTHWELGEHNGKLMGTHWELKRNIVETHWELGKNEKKLPPSSPKLKRKKSKAPWVHAWAFPLAAWNFSSQKSQSLFLAWANTPCKEHPTYYYVNSFVFRVNSTLWLQGPNIVKNSNTRLNILYVLNILDVGKR
jgi:hypothetical protein